jgi:hypothetical protein
MRNAALSAAHDQLSEQMLRIQESLSWRLIQKDRKGHTYLTRFEQNGSDLRGVPWLGRISCRHAKYLELASHSKPENLAVEATIVSGGRSGAAIHVFSSATSAEAQCRLPLRERLLSGLRTFRGAKGDEGLMSSTKQVI